MSHPLERFYVCQYATSRAYISATDWNTYYNACLASNSPRITVIKAKKQCWVDYDVQNTRIYADGCIAEIKNSLHDMHAQFKWPKNAGIGCSNTIIRTKIGSIHKIPLENWLDVASMIYTIFANRRITDTENSG